jgi:uncharacterized protein DUF4436
LTKWSLRVPYRTRHFTENIEITRPGQIPEGKLTRFFAACLENNLSATKAGIAIGMGASTANGNAPAYDAYEAGGPMWKKKPTKLRIGIILCIAAVYAAVLVRATTESTRRSLQLRDETSAQDRVVVSVLVTGVDPVAQELNAQLGFRLAGDFARDEVTPAADLKLLVNNVRGQQEFDFPKGKRVNRIEVVFPLNGDLNRYPFDRYQTTVWLLMTTPAANNKSQAPKILENKLDEAPHAEQLAVGAETMQRSTPLPLSLALSAVIPGIKFRGSVTRNESTQVTGISLNLRRADNLITVSILINAMMTGLAASVLAMVLVMTASRESDLFPLSLSISLIFGLPALRSVQPGVPPVGAFSDYVTFIWAELIVAVSAVIAVWHWLVRVRADSGSK